MNFNESEWIKLIFLPADTRQWLNELSQQTFDQVPLKNNRKLFRKTYHPGAKAIAHFAERHYYKFQDLQVRVPKQTNYKQRSSKQNDHEVKEFFKI